MDFANTKHQSLVEHNFAVGYLAGLLIDKLDFNSEINNHVGDKRYLKNLAKLSGFFHDIGKIDPQFQRFLQLNKVTSSEIEDGVHINVSEKDDFSFNNYIRHNELSFALLMSMIDTKSLIKLINNEESFKTIAYAVFWHHAKVFRNNEYKDNFNNIDKILYVFDQHNPDFDYQDCVCDYLKQIEILETKYSEKEGFKYSSLVLKKVVKNAQNIPKFKATYQINQEPNFAIEIKNTIIRSVLVTADRIISILSHQELKNIIDKKEIHLLVDNYYEKSSDISLLNDLASMLDLFEKNALEDSDKIERNTKQLEVVEKLKKIKNICVLSGSAGCGKTKVFLQWLKESKELNQAFIITPRNMICKNLFDQITSSDYLPNSTVEIYTGEYKLKSVSGILENIEEKEAFSSSIVITTIDQLVNIMLSHNKIDIFLRFMKSHIIFDEFHEFFNISGLVFLFKEFIMAKSFLNDTKTLLVSATPNYFFLDFLEVDKKNIIELKTFNKKDYTFKFIAEESNIDIASSELHIKRETKDIVVFNTATQSQISSLYTRDQHNEYNLNYHSKFTKADKSLLIEEIKKIWGEFADEKIVKKEFPKILRAGPIIQASLNISTNNMITEACSAENWCQRLGRVNRFAKNEIATFTTVYDKSIDTNEVQRGKGNHKFLNTLNMLDQTIAWNNFILSKKITSGNLFTIYELYKEFHMSEDAREAYKKDFKKIVIESLKKFSKDYFDPLNNTIKTIKKSNSKYLKKYTLRGSNIYVLPVKMNLPVKKDDYENKKTWLYIPSQNVSDEETITIENNYEVLEDFAIRQKLFDPSSKKIFQNADYKSKTSIQQIFKSARNKAAPLIVSYLNHNVGLFYIKNEDLLIGLIDISKISEFAQEITIYKIMGEKDISLDIKKHKKMIEDRIKEKTGEK